MGSAVTTEAGICNIALLNVGSRGLLNSLNEQTTEAMACKAHYASARDALLERFPWKFATTRATLALIANTTVSGWDYVYELPSNCMVPQRIWSGSRMPHSEDKIPFDVEMVRDTAGNPSVRALLTDHEDASLIYTVQQTTVALFSPLFVDALAWELSKRLALCIPVKPGAAQLAEAMFKQAFAHAGASQFRHMQPDVAPESEFISGR